MKSRYELSLENAFVAPHPSLSVPLSDLLPVPSPTLDDSILFPDQLPTGQSPGVCEVRYADTPKSDSAAEASATEEKTE